MARLALNVRTKRRGLPVIVASANKGVIRVDIEQLRHQIDQLHAQAEITRSKGPLFLLPSIPAALHRNVFLVATVFPLCFKLTFWND
ncbi:hypothetical protein MA16_Dca023622 [Dendrobium catenatum]|uniref:Uncharacterized protein n=1 Tax=Dendrobium catenatum TaxID=906689 RepID=A0A2I0W2B5_9ASPA|nr:hypothetical protein MA16_Dca023622 [Dendrobium catenatum]